MEQMENEVPEIRLCDVSNEVEAAMVAVPRVGFRLPPLTVTTGALFCGAVTVKLIQSLQAKPSYA